MSMSILPASTRKRVTLAAAVAAVAVSLSACSTAAPQPESEQTAPTGPVTLIVHDSFPGEEFAAAASEALGFEVKVVTSGDSGELATQLALTAGAPVADAFYGVDNLYVSRLVNAGAAAPYASASLPDSAADFSYDSDNSVTPIDYGATCINIDNEWFAANELAKPETFEDLADPKYKNLSVVIDPTSSSTGGTWLLGTIAHFGPQVAGDGSFDGDGEGFGFYWNDLVKNGAKIAEGWTAAYEGEFTQGGGDGKRPIVLSYSTSPAWTISEDGKSSTTSILPATCAQHIEYAGVLKGTANEAGAQAVIDYMLSREFQDTIAESMYMYPVDSAAYVPAEWQEFAPIPAGGAVASVDPQIVDENRDAWLKTWSAAVGY